MTDVELAKALLAGDVTPLRIAKLRRHLLAPGANQQTLDSAKVERVLGHLESLTDADTLATVRAGLAR